jgi:hypothetical protein
MQMDVGPFCKTLKDRKGPQHISLCPNRVCAEIEVGERNATIIGNGEDANQLSIRSSEVAKSCMMRAFIMAVHQQSSLMPGRSSSLGLTYAKRVVLRVARGFRHDHPCMWGTDDSAPCGCDW